MAISAEGRFLLCEASGDPDALAALTRRADAGRLGEAAADANARATACCADNWLAAMCS